MVTSLFVIAALDGWWASVRTPPTMTPPPETSVNVLWSTVIDDAPRPIPEACAFASLPMPSATWPRWVNVLPLKEIPEAAETWTAAGAWAQLPRAPSNCLQPDWHEVRKSPGIGAAAGRNVPVCWFAYPTDVLGVSHVVCSKCRPLKARLRAGLS